MTHCQGSRPLQRLHLSSIRGFTLVELTVVVVIVAMLLSLGLGALNAQLLSANFAQTKSRQTLIKDALTAYLGANKRLPCPDVPNNTNGGADTSQVTGLEDRAGGVATGACTGSIGIVPYATLGLGREIALDGWGSFMSYSLPSGSTPCPGSGIDWSLTACFGTAKASPYSLFDGTTATPVLAASNVIAFVISHGPNGLAAWAQQGSRNALPIGCEEAHNAIVTVSGCTLTANAFYKGERPEVDDVVAYLTRDEAINTLAKQGTIKTSEGQVVEDLARLRNNKLYQKASAPSCANSVGSIPDIDPWGNTYGVVEGSTNNLPICICTTRGTGLMPGATCNPTAPTTCLQVNVSDVNLLRVPMGQPIC